MDRKALLQKLIDSRFKGNQAEFARSIRRSAAQVNQWLSGHRTLGDAGVWHIEKVLDLPRGYFDGKFRPDAGLGPATSLPQYQPVPVVGTVTAGDNGFFYDIDPTPDGHIQFPARDKDTYAVRVRGDSMRPRIKPGEFLVVEPGRQPQPGDEVVVTTTDARQMVKEYLYQRNGEITLGSINNGHGNVTLAVGLIKTMHTVVGIMPSFALCVA